VDLVTQIYRASGNLPKSEFYGLIFQLRQSVVSIPSNIAEGYGRRSTGNYVRFLQIFVVFYTSYKLNWKFRKSWNT